MAGILRAQDKAQHVATSTYLKTSLPVKVSAPRDRFVIPALKVPLLLGVRSPDILFGVSNILT